MRERSLVILAAGRGSRYGEAKQWTPVGPKGEPLLAYALKDGWQAGFSQAVLVVPEGSTPKALPFEAPRGMRIEWVEQRIEDLPGLQRPHTRERPWGTAHAVWAARHRVKGAFAVINADDYYGPNALQRLGEYVRSGTRQGLLVAYVLKNTLSVHGAVSRGVCFFQGKHLVGLQEHTQVLAEADRILGLSPAGQRVELGPQTPVSMNCWGLPETFWPVLERRLETFAHMHSQSPDAECYLPHCVEALLPTTPIEVTTTPERWAGLTHPGDFKAVSSLVSLRS